MPDPAPDKRLEARRFIRHELERGRERAALRQRFEQLHGGLDFDRYYEAGVREHNDLIERYATVERRMGWSVVFLGCAIASLFALGAFLELGHAPHPIWVLPLAGYGLWRVRRARRARAERIILDGAA